MPTETVTKVVDASAIIALLFDEPEAGAIASKIQKSWLVAPVLIDFELANACLTKIRRRPTERDELVSAFLKRSQFAIEIQPVDHIGVLELAEATGLTAYDASYLWLARALSAELVTLEGGWRKRRPPSPPNAPGPPPA